jgi:PAS domain S-box-containing protein
MAEEMFGYAPDELIGNNIKKLMPDPYEREHDTCLSNFQETGIKKIICVGREVFGKRKDGTTFPLDLTVNKFPSSEQTKFIGTLHDLSARNKSEQELIAARLEAEAASRVKTEFLANMSHELRTPLNAIIGFSSTLKDGLFGSLANDKQQEYVGIIQQSGDHFLDLINDILDVSAIEAGKLKLDETEIDVYALADSMIMQHRAELGGVTLSIDIRENLGQIRADGRRLKYILLNLLSNAVKLSSEGDDVMLRCRPKNNRSFEFEITDTGTGMSKEDIK